METLLHAGLSNALSATFLALLVACLGRLLARRPAILHCLWLLVLLKLVTPPLYEVAIPWPESLAAREEAAATPETRLTFNSASGLDERSAAGRIGVSSRQTRSNAEAEPAADRSRRDRS